MMEQFINQQGARKNHGRGREARERPQLSGSELPRPGVGAGKPGLAGEMAAGRDLPHLAQKQRELAAPSRGSRIIARYNEFGRGVMGPGRGRQAHVDGHGEWRQGRAGRGSQRTEEHSPAVGDAGGGGTKRSAREAEYLRARAVEQHTVRRSQQAAIHKHQSVGANVGGAEDPPMESGRQASAEQTSFRRQMTQKAILNSYYGIRAASRSVSRSNVRAERDSSDQSQNFSQLRSNYTRSPLVSVSKYAMAAEADADEGVGCSAKSICISNVNDANNFKRKVQQTKQVNRNIYNSFLKSPSKSYFAADRSERSPVVQDLQMARIGKGGVFADSPARDQAPTFKQRQAHAATARRAPGKIFGAPGHSAQGPSTAVSNRARPPIGGANWQTTQPESRKQKSSITEKEEQKQDEGAKESQKEGFFASVLKSAGLGHLAGVSNQANEPHQASEDSIIHTHQADSVAHFGGGLGAPGGEAPGEDSFRGPHRRSTDMHQQIQAEARLTYNPFVDLPDRAQLSNQRSRYPGLATDHCAEESDSDLKNPTFNFEQNIVANANDEMRQSQELHKLKLQQEKNKKIRDRLLDEIGQTEATQQNLANNLRVGEPADPTTSRLSGDGKEDTLARLGQQLSALNANLQNKLQEKFQENFKWELRSIRSHSARSGKTKSARPRDGDARSDGDASASALSASGLGTVDEMTSMSQLNLSETELIQQTKIADRQIELLQKQITLMEKRQRVQQLEEQEAIPVPNPNNSEKNLNEQNSGGRDGARDEALKLDGQENNAELKEMYAQLDEAMRPFSAAPEEAESGSKEHERMNSLVEPASPAAEDEVEAPRHSEQKFQMDYPQDDQRLSNRADEVAVDKVGHGLIERKFTNDLRADEVFESDDYKSLKQMAKEFEQEQNEKHLMELIQRKDTPPRSGSTTGRKMAQNKDSYDLFKQSPSDKDHKRANMLENVNVGDDESIRVPNYSQKKLVNKLKVMGSQDLGPLSANHEYFNVAQRPPLMKARAHELGQNIHMMISQLNAVQQQIKKDISEFHKYQQLVLQEQNPADLESADEPGPAHESSRPSSTPRGDSASPIKRLSSYGGPAMSGMKRNNKIFGRGNRGLLPQRRTLHLAKLQTSNCSSQRARQSDGHPINMSTDGVRFKNEKSLQAAGNPNCCRSEAVDRLDGPEAISTYAHLNNVQSQQHHDSMVSTQSKGLLDVTLGGQSKLSRPVSSYQKLDGADLASPEVADGISSEEDGDGDGQQARQEEAVATKALPRPEKQQDRQSPPEAQEGSPTSLEYLGVDIQDFNKKIQKHLPVVIHAQSSLNEENTEKQLGLDKILSQVVESPRARRSTLSNQKMENVDSLTRLSLGNGTLTAQVAQMNDLSGSSLAETRRNRQEQIITKEAASQQQSLGPESEVSPRKQQRIHNSESSGAEVAFSNDQGGDVRDVAKAVEGRQQEGDSNPSGQSGQRQPPIHAQVIEEMDEINRIQSAIDNVQFDQKSEFAGHVLGDVSMKSEEHGRPLTSNESQKAVALPQVEQQKIQVVHVEDNFTTQWPSSFPTHNRSSQKSLSAKSQMSDRTMDRLERANHRLNKKMLRASIEQNKVLRGSFVEQANDESGTRRPARRNMFSRSPKSFNDVQSASKSFTGASGPLPRQSPNAAAFRGASISDHKVSSANGSDFGDKRSSSIITGGEFSRLCGNVVQKKYRKEKYAKLVSVPSLYRKCCEQILQGLSVNSQNFSEKRSMMTRLETFVDREYRLQIQSYKIQFNDFGDEADGSRADKKQHKDNEKLLLSSKSQEEVAAPQKQAQMQSNGNMVASPRQQEVDRLAGLKQDGELEPRTKLTFGRKEAPDFEENEGQGRAELSKPDQPHHGSTSEPVGFSSSVLEYNGMQPELALFEFDAERDTMAVISPGDLQGRQQQVVPAHQITKEQAEPESYFNRGAHLTLGKAPQKGSASSEEDAQEDEPDQHEALHLPPGGARQDFGLPAEKRQKPTKANLFAGKDGDHGGNGQRRSQTGSKKSRKLLVGKPNLLKQFLTNDAPEDQQLSLDGQPIDEALARESTGPAGLERFSAGMPRHTLSNLQIARLSAKKSSKSKARQATAADRKRVGDHDAQRLSFARGAPSGVISGRPEEDHPQDQDPNNQRYTLSKQSQGGDTPRFKDKLLTANDKQALDYQSSSDNQPLPFD